MQSGMGARAAGRRARVWMGARGPGGHGDPAFLEKSSKELLEGGLRRGFAELRAAGFGWIVVVRDVVGGFLTQPVLDYGLAFLEVRLGGDGVVDLFVG